MFFANYWKKECTVRIPFDERESYAVGGVRLSFEFETPPTHNPPTWFLVWQRMLTIFIIKNQVRGLCVGGGMVILFCGSFHDKTTIRRRPYLRLHTHSWFLLQPTFLIFGTVIDIVSIFYHAKNQVAREKPLILLKTSLL